MFPDDPSTPTPHPPPRVSSLLSSPSLSLAVAFPCLFPSRPAFPLSRRVLFTLYPSSTLCLLPSFSPSHVLFFLSPFSFFRILFRIKRWRKTRRDSKFREILGFRVANTWRRFSSTRPLRALTVGYAPLFSLRAVPSFSSTCGLSSHSNVVRIRDVPVSPLFRVAYPPSPTSQFRNLSIRVSGTISCQPPP